ncbi:MAG: serine hydrolase domain-containing protein, partial [Verrucomicrobiota bacterium]
MRISPSRLSGGFLSILIFLILHGPSVELALVTAAPLSSEKIKAFRGELGDALSASRIRGASITWISGKEDEPAHFFDWGHSDNENQHEVTRATPFRAGSISKLIVSLLALRAAEAGTIALNQPVESELGVVFSPRPSEDVTLAQLLEHTSGLAGSSYREYAANIRALSPSSYVEENSPFSLRWEPGWHYSYSNPGYTVAGAFLEVATGIPFDELMAQEIFKPLEMARSHFCGSRSSTENHDDLISFEDDGRTLTRRWEMPVRPAGALVTTSEDLSKLIRTLLHSSAPDSGEPFLSNDSIARLHSGKTSAAARSGLESGSYGLGNFGFVASGHLFRGHWGRTEGYQATLGYLPEDGRGFAILANTADRRGMNKIREMIASFLTSDLIDPLAKTSERKADPLDKAFNGLYVNHSHDMPIRAWLFALLDARSIESAEGGFTSDPANGLGETRTYRGISGKRFHDLNLPVPTATFFEKEGELFFADGESFRRIPRSEYYGSLFLFLGGLFFAGFLTLSLIGSLVKEVVVRFRR